MVLVLVPVATAVLFKCWPAMCGSVGEGAAFTTGALPKVGFLSAAFPVAFNLLSKRIRTGSRWGRFGGIKAAYQR
jgi:hypothetical protein